MVVIRVAGFGGENRALNLKLLSDTVGVLSRLEGNDGGSNGLLCGRVAQGRPSSFYRRAAF